MKAVRLSELPFIWHPWTHVGIAVILSAAAQVWMKLGANTVVVGGWWSLLGFQGLASWWTWLGILAYILSFGSWLLRVETFASGLCL